MKVKTRAFKDSEGNSMIFPSLVVLEETGRTYDGSMSEFDVNQYAQMLPRYVDITIMPEWFEFDDEDFQHFSGELESSAFKHGYATSLIYAGPLFEENLKLQDTEDVVDA